MMDKIVDGLLELRLLHSCLTVQSGVRRIAVSLYSKISMQRPLDVLPNIFLWHNYVTSLVFFSSRS